MKFFTSLSLLGILAQQVTCQLNFFSAEFVLFVQDMRQNFLDNNQLGFITVGNAQEQVVSPRMFKFIEGSFRDAFVNDALGVNANNVVVGTFPLASASALQNIFENVDLAGDNLQVAVETGFANLLNVADRTAIFDAADAATLLYSAELTANVAIARGPKMFCVDSAQCRGNRNDQKFGSTIVRDCNNLELGDGVNPNCDAFVAFFTLQWLGAFIIGVYVIIILWAVYFGYPVIKKKFSKKKGGAGGAGAANKGKPQFDAQQQLIINTLASQCASAENMLFQATHMLKQAQHAKTLINAESRRESRLLIMTCELFQALSAVMVSLTHQYLDEKANNGAEQFNDYDPAVRALQLEVLNYCRDRLTLAFQSEAFTEKSLLRIAEAYCIMKKISDSLVFVGFSYDQEQDDGLGHMRTPYVELTENAIFMSGIFKPNRGAIETGFDGSQVCINIKNSDSRGLREVGALYYLSDGARDTKDYDPLMQAVTRTPGKTLVYNMTNAGTQGETLQYFVRTFWGPEIAEMQQTASGWLSSKDGLEQWLAQEKREREMKASPVVKRGAKKKRKKHKKNKDKYQDMGDNQSEYTDYTEASGWSVNSNNTYVFNVNSVVNQGLGIAGKPGLPYDKLGQNIRKSSKAWQFFEKYFPNAAEWPKFYTFVFVIMPLIIGIPMLAKAGKGAAIIDIDGNVAFKARPAGFGFSFLGVPAYYFLDGEVPDENEDLILTTDVQNEVAVQTVLNLIDANQQDPFNNGRLFMSNDFVEELFDQFDGGSGRNPDFFVAEIQGGVLVQANVDELALIRNQQLGQEFGTTLIYALMHNAGYFFGAIPISLVRESLEILARKFSFIREIYPMSQWRDLHMNMGLAGIFYVTFGASVFLVMMLVSMGRGTPFSGLSGDPNIPNFFDFNANVLYLRQLLLPAVPLLLLMKYAARGPPVWMQKYAPTYLTKHYWEICYFLHYLTALTAIIMLVLYRPQVFYWMGATWGFVWGGNKIVRILRTRKTTIKTTSLISYTVEDKRNNAKKRSDVLRITLNVPRSFPSSARGQACWLTIPEIDYIAHPFTLAKVPTPEDPSITFHIGIKYLAGDDVISYARPETTSVKKMAAPPPTNPNELPPGWKSAVDPESGQTYYYNSAQQLTTWERPKVTAVDKMFEGARALTSRFSTAMLRGQGSTRFGQVQLGNVNTFGENTSRVLGEAKRATWTQNLARLSEKLSGLDPELMKNSIKEHPVYVSAPLGTSMDDCLLPSLPGSIIITTQNGLPAAESSVRWLLKQTRQHRPKFHFFVSVSREVNDALSVVETLRDALCDAVVAGNIDIDGLNPRHAHMADWLGVYIHLTRRKPSQIEGDRDMLMNSLNPPAAPVTPQQLDIIQNWLRNRVSPGRLDFQRFLQRANQMVMKRAGADRIAVGYCGSAKIAYSIRAAAREIPNMSFDGEYI